MKLKKYLNWKYLKQLNSSKFINSMYIYIFLVPIFIKIIELVNSKINIQLNLPFSLIFFYFSALFFALGNILLNIKCPLIIKENNSFGDFLTSGKKLFQLKPYIEDINIDLDFNFDDEAFSILIENKDDSIDEHRKLQNYFWEIYNKANIKYQNYIKLIFIFYSLGFILFLIVLLENLIFIIGSFI